MILCLLLLVPAITSAFSTTISVYQLGARLRATQLRVLGEAISTCTIDLKINEEEQASLDSGSRVWDAGRALSTYFSQQQEATTSIRGRRILELGSGTGIVGLMAAVLGAEEVVLTDKPEMLPLTRKNIEANGLENCRTLPLVWGEDNSLDPNFDMICGSDLLYAPESFELLLGTLQQVAQPGSTQIWLAYPTRFTEDIFLDQAYQEGFVESEETQEIEAGIYLSKLMLR